MMGGSRGSPRAVRYRVPDARRAGGGAGGVGLGGVQPVRGLPPTVGAVRPTLAELRRRAEMARDNQPSAARYIIWSLAIASGQPFSEIEKVRVKDWAYLAEFLKTRKVPDGIR